MTSKTRDKTVQKKNIKERIFGKNSKAKTSKTSASKDEKDKIESFISGKTLEIKLGSNIKCEIIPESELEGLGEALEENEDNKIIVIIPELMISELEKVIKKYLDSTGVDISAVGKYLNADFFKNILLPYKGLRCTISDREFMIWKEGKIIILTVETK